MFNQLHRWVSKLQIFSVTTFLRRSSMQHLPESFCFPQLCESCRRRVFSACNLSHQLVQSDDHNTLSEVDLQKAKKNIEHFFKRQFWDNLFQKYKVKKLAQVCAEKWKEKQKQWRFGNILFPLILLIKVLF